MRSALTRSIPAVAIAALALAGSALAQPLRQSTAQVQINPGGAFDPAKPGFFALGPVAGQKPYLRELPGARAQASRSKRRTSRTYFAASTTSSWPTRSRPPGSTRWPRSSPTPAPGARRRR